MVAHFRHYITLAPHWLVFAYHLGLQHQILGQIPYYNINEIATLSYPYEEQDGLGSRTTVRGIRYNRIAAAGYAWGNLEFRITPFRLTLWKQHIDLILNPFMDAAAITRPYRLEKQMDTPYYQALKQPVMLSFGLGAKALINTNIMFSVDVARGLGNQVGCWTVSTASVFIF